MDEKQVTIKKTQLPSDILFEDDAHQGLENVKTESLLSQNKFMMVLKE